MSEVVDELVVSFREVARKVAQEEIREALPAILTAADRHVETRLNRWRPVPAFDRSEESAQVPVPRPTGPLAAQYQACPKCGK